MSLRTIVAFIHTFYEPRINNSRIYEWLADETLPPFPAYLNLLRKNNKGEPTLAFKKSQVRAWFETVIRPVKAS
ncbi:hypothetical protein [Mesoterricola silvestris]|uniref:hypothetical protein n=1 Tax=Mesoterricola silvestris TaxID=2927979 RepID=UPI0029302978|nr:hypothetical protein [Mesoterricola silvestris]